jgi:[ribosomal protein S18]-alanine N-acetyltransferase
MITTTARYGANQHRAQQLRVTIAEFNRRAQRVWEQLGFEPVEKFAKIGSEEEFVIIARAV